MAIWYVDPINGDNTKSGNSFANRRLSLNASGPSGDTPGNYFADTANLADGDEVRIIKSPDFTSLGNGTWTAKTQTAVIEDSISNCTGVKGSSTTTINCPSAHGLTTGDPVYIGTPFPAVSNLQGLYEATVTSTTQFTVSVNTSSDTWTDNSSTFTVYINLKYNCIKLQSSYTEEIAFCAGRAHQWISANANINGGVGNKNFTSEDYSAYTSGYNGAKISVTNSSNQFGASGKAAYYQLPSTLDLSSYQQICFKAGFSSGLPDGAFDNFISIKLCSDNTGDVVVHSIPLTRCGGRYMYNFEVVKNFGTNLSNNINSVALHIDANVVYDYDIYVDQIMACQASGPTLNSVISKSNDNVNAVEHYTVSDIVGNFVFFGEKHPYRTDKVTQSTLKYSGTSETVTTYHRPALSMITAAHFGYYSYWFYFSNITDEFIANGLTISGGWNETDMSTQTGHTVIDGLQNSNGVILFNTRYANFVNISRISSARLFHHTQTYDNGAVNLEKCTIYGGKYGNMTINGFGGSTVKDCFLIGGDPNFQDSKGVNITYDNCTLIRQNCFSNDDGGSTTMLIGRGTHFKDCTMRDMRSAQGNSFYYTADNSYDNCTFDAFNTSSWHRFHDSAASILRGGRTRIKNCTWTNYTGNFIIQSGASTRFQNDHSYLAFHNYNGAAGDHRIYFNNVTMFSESTVRYASTGIAWKISTTSTDYNASNPFSRVFIESFVSASTQVTASIWVRRTNTGMTVQLGALKDENDFDIGLTSDVITSMTAAADTWEQISISFIPPKAGKCKIRVFVYGGSTYSAYVDAPTITQV